MIIFEAIRWTPALLQTIPQSVDYIRILPELVLSAFGIIVMLIDPVVDEKTSQKFLGLIALAGALFGIAATWYMSQSPGLAFSNMIRVDAFSVFFHFLVFAIPAAVIPPPYPSIAVHPHRPRKS